MELGRYMTISNADALEEGEDASSLLTRCQGCVRKNARVVSAIAATVVIAMSILAVSSVMMPGGISAAAHPQASLVNAACKLTPERMEGPFYLQEDLFRANLTENEPGVPLTLRINVTDPDCNPLANTFVDIWQCNSTGFYSGFTGDSGGPGGPGGKHDHGHGHHGDKHQDHHDHDHKHGGHGDDDHHKHDSHDHDHKHGKGKGEHGHGKGKHGGGKGRHGPPQTDELTFLRGTLLTDDSGIVEFVTTVPGWYPGRAPHIHMKIHIPDDNGAHDTEAGEYADSHVSHTGQVFFSEDFYGQIELLEPYTGDVHHRTLLTEDHDYHNDPTAVLNITKNDLGTLQDGVSATITIIVDPKSEPAPIRPGVWERMIAALPPWLQAFH